MGYENAWWCSIIVDADVRVIEKRIEKKYLDQMAYTLDEAIAISDEAVKNGTPTSIAVVGNAVDVFEEAYEKGFMPDIISEMCPCHDAGMPEEEAMTITGFVSEYIRPLFCEGRGPLDGHVSQEVLMILKEQMI